MRYRGVEDVERLRRWFCRREEKGKKSEVNAPADSPAGLLTIRCDREMLSNLSPMPQVSEFGTVHPLSPRNGRMV